MSLKRVDVKEAKRMKDDEGYALVDVRSMGEFAEGHPDGSLNIPFRHKTPQGMIANQDFERIIQFQFPELDARILLTCEMGARSVRAAQTLMNLGYTHVVDVKGGFGGEKDERGEVINQGWQDAGLPSETGEPEDRTYRSINNRANNARAAAAAETTAAPTSVNQSHRFASSKRVVQCAKLGKELPGLKRRPYPGPLGERCFKEISADAWNEWVEHSKMIINEYRLHSTDPNAIKMLMEMCEKFLFSEGGMSQPEGYVPESK